MANLENLASEAEAILAQIVAAGEAREAVASNQGAQTLSRAGEDISAIRKAAESRRDQPQDPETWGAILKAAERNPSVAAQVAKMRPASENSEEGQKRRAVYRARREAERKKERRKSLFNVFRRVVDAEIVKPPPLTAGQRRRAAYRAGKRQQQRGARRQRLIDRMANRTVGGRMGTLAQSLGGMATNPASIGQQLPRALGALGIGGGAAAAGAGAAAAPVAAALAAAYAIKQATMGAVAASSPFMGKAEHQVATGMADSASNAALFGPLGMAYELTQLPKHITEWDEALLESKKGLAAFSGTLNRYFAEAERRKILRDVQSAQTTGGAVSALGGEWQKFLDEVRPLKDDITTHLAAILTMGTQMLRAVVLIAKVTTPVMQVLAAIYRASLPKETGSTAFGTFTSNLDPHPGRIGSRRAPQRGRP